MQSSKSFIIPVNKYLSISSPLSGNLTGLGISGPLNISTISQSSQSDSVFEVSLFINFTTSVTFHISISFFFKVNGKMVVSWLRFTAPLGQDNGGVFYVSSTGSVRE